MRMARPTSHFALTPSDRAILQGWLRMSTLEQSLALRARILLLRRMDDTQGHQRTVAGHAADSVQVAKTLSGGGRRGLERSAT